MKPVANTVKIGYVKRKDTDESPNVYQLGINPNSQNPTGPLPRKEQHHPKRKQDHSTPTKELFSHQQHPSTFISPNNVHLQEVNDDQQRRVNDLNSNMSSLPYDQQKRNVDNLQRIPTKTKCLTKRKVLLGTVAALLLATIITVPIVLGILLTRTSETTSTTTTTASTKVIFAQWNFDGTLSDVYNIYNGLGINSPIYTAVPSNTTPYVGYGQALSLSSASSQYVSVSTPFLNLSYRSFTIEAWIYPQNLAGDSGIFGQCSCSTCANQCLYFICRGTRLYIGFTSNDLTGSTDMSINTWYHVAFVYNYQTQQQILYLNGVQDSIKSNAAPYQGQNGSITIGSTQTYSSTNYFIGSIDNLKVRTGAKSSTEILRAGTLIVYYSFDSPNPAYDNGPNGLNGTSNSTVTVTGRVNEAMRFSGSGSYFRIFGIYNIVQGAVIPAQFSVSMWVNPATITNYTLAQIFRTSFSTATSNCANLLGTYSNTGSYAQFTILSVGNSQASITGPYVSTNTWTHVSVTYSSTNGFTLYINGNYFGMTGTKTIVASGAFANLFIGYYGLCTISDSNSPYQGAIDEVYVHSRELTQSDVTALASP